VTPVPNEDYDMKYRITYGDKVLVYVDEKRRFFVEVQRGAILGTDKGFIKHEELLDKRYGERIKTSLGYEAFLFKPLLIDYQFIISRRTQIIYPKDASLMIYLSSIKPGSIVLEAGVGSGFLTISLASFVGENGKVYGYDIVPQHLEVARSNLEKAGLADRVILKLGDVRKGVEIDSEVDAVFYDLPDPWNALDTAYNVLKDSHPLIVYLPTINQVERTVVEMRRRGLFADIHVYEVLMREYEIEEGASRPKTTMIGHTGFIVFARKIV